MKQQQDVKEGKDEGSSLKEKPFMGRSSFQCLLHRKEKPLIDLWCRDLPIFLRFLDDAS